jgi:hypothetical protein
MYSIFPPKNINAQGKKSLPQEHDRKEKVNKSGSGVFFFFLSCLLYKYNRKKSILNAVLMMVKGGKLLVANSWVVV